MGLCVYITVSVCTQVETVLSRAQQLDRPRALLHALVTDVARTLRQMCGHAPLAPPLTGAGDLDGLTRHGRAGVEQMARRGALHQMEVRSIACACEVLCFSS